MSVFYCIRLDHSAFQETVRSDETVEDQYELYAMQVHSGQSAQRSLFGSQIDLGGGQKHKGRRVGSKGSALSETLLII